ncbi:MAG: hypothetical protein IKJ19_01680 [Clostridia bacterium]|nr:hypothetical protein [Clostridia bacterium]
MDIYKILCIALIGASLCFYLKSINSDFYVLILLCSGTIILFFSLNYLVTTLEVFQNFIKSINVDSSLFTVLLKIILVAYLIEFAVSTIEDFGIKSLADKLSFAGKIILFCMSLPIFKCLAEVVLQFLG